MKQITILLLTILLVGCSEGSESPKNFEGTFEFNETGGGNPISGTVKLNLVGEDLYEVQPGTKFTINSIEYTNTVTTTIGLIGENLLEGFRFEADEDNYLIFGWTEIGVSGGSFSPGNYDEIDYPGRFSWSHCYAADDCMQGEGVKGYKLKRK